MDSYAVKKLYTDARKSLEACLSRELADSILIDMLSKYHGLLTDEELLDMIEIREEEVCQLRMGCVFTADVEQLQLWRARLNHLAQLPSVQKTLDTLNADEQEHEGFITWALK